MTSQTLSRRVRSPEDIQVGDFVAVTHTRYQFVPDHLEPSMSGRAIEPIEVTALPDDAGRPLKVLSVCLPFIIGQAVCGLREVIDTRRYVLTKVSKSYAKAAKPREDKPKRKGKKRKGKGKKKNKSG